NAEGQERPPARITCSRPRSELRADLERTGDLVRVAGRVVRIDVQDRVIVEQEVVLSTRADREVADEIVEANADGDLRERIVTDRGVAAVALVYVEPAELVAAEGVGLERTHVRADHHEGLAAVFDHVLLCAGESLVGLESSALVAELQLDDRERLDAHE